MVAEDVGRKGGPKRVRSAQLNVRQHADVRCAFKACLERLKGVVHKAGGGKLTQSALVEYWSIWFARLGPEEQKAWARTYREAATARLEGIEANADGLPATDYGGHAGGYPMASHERPADEAEASPGGAETLPKRGRRKKV